MLGGYQRGPGIDEGLLLKKDVEGRALANAGFLAYAVERNLRGRHLGLRGEDLRLCGLELAPRGHHPSLDLVARGFEVSALLRHRLLGGADRRKSIRCSRGPGIVD